MSLDRINRRLAELRGLLDQDGALRARTQDALCGSLACPDLEEHLDMKNDRHVNLRLPAALLARVEALRPRIAEDPKLQAARVTNAVVIRLALIHGLDALEAEYGRDEQ